MIWLGKDKSDSYEEVGQKIYAGGGLLAQLSKPYYYKELTLDTVIQYEEQLLRQVLI